jgi:hypothetical protein
VKDESLDCDEGEEVLVGRELTKGDMGVRGVPFSDCRERQILWAWVFFLVWRQGVRELRRGLVERRSVVQLNKQEVLSSLNFKSLDSLH